jgi:acetate kinase
MRDQLDANDHDAKLALAMFVSSAAMAIAATATTLDRWQWLVFTGGVASVPPLFEPGYATGYDSRALKLSSCPPTKNV